MRQDYLLEEVLSQPTVPEVALQRYLGQEDPLRPASVYLNQQGIRAVMIETSELIHYHADLASPRALVVVASQSSESSEARQLVDRISPGTLVISITNGSASCVARHSDLGFDMFAGEENGPSPKTYTSCLMVALLCAMTAAGGISRREIQEPNEAIDAMRETLHGCQDPAQPLADFVRATDGIALLGCGPSMASAMTGSLILEEISKVHAEGVSAGQFRHGPLELASAGFCAIVFCSPGRTGHLNERLADEMAGYGSRIVLVGTPPVSPKRKGIFQLQIPSLEELFSPLIEILPIQLLTRELAIRRGLEPGVFVRGKKVTTDE